MVVNRATFNVVFHAIAFLCYVLSFNTMSNAQKYLLKSVEMEDPEFHVETFYTFCVHFAAFSAIALFAPYITNLLGPRPTMIIGAFLQLLYNVQFLFPKVWLVYLGSASRGFGAAVMWTAQGRYITQNSNMETITMNSGIFFGILNMHRIFGNMYVYFRFNEREFTKYERKELYIVMVGGCATSCLLFLCLTKAVYNHPVKISLWRSFVCIFNLARERDMILIICTCFYSSLQLSFTLATYSNALGFTVEFGFKPIKIISLSGLLIGAGSFISGIAFAFYGKELTSHGRYPVIIIGFITQLIASIICIFNLPNYSHLGFTKEKAIVKSNIHVALLGSFLYGMGDSLYTTQIYGLLGIHFKEEITAAHSLYRFSQAIAAIFAFLCFSHLNMCIIQLLLIAFSVLGTVSFCVVELKPTYRSPVRVRSSSIILETIPESALSIHELL